MDVLQKFVWLGALLLVFVSASFGQTEFKTDDPVAYNDHIVEIQEKVGQEMLEFSNTLLTSNDFNENETKRQDVLKELELSLRQLRNMAAFKGGSKLKKEAISVMEYYRDLFKYEYARVAALVTSKESSISALETYFELQVEAEKKLKTNSDRLRLAQKAFAKENNVLVLDNPMQDQFDRILDANIYSREVFLAYLAVAKVNEAWWDAFQAQEQEEMQTNRIVLEDAAKKSKLNAMPDFLGDSGFKDAALARVNYYGTLAADTYNRMEAILRNDERTVEDVNWLNDQVDAYNKMNQELNDRFNQAQRELKLRALPAPSGGKD